ncbi:MAG: hypothetical protein IJ242_02300 [Clostridia bacterium]|nr:hypothetical protein [Clostridia bacterium]
MHLTVQKKSSLFHILLLTGIALVIPFLLFTVLNNCLTLWPLYTHSRIMLCILTPLSFTGLFILKRYIARRQFGINRHLLLGFAAAFFCIQLICALLLRHTPFTDTEQIVTASVNLATTGAFETSPRSFQYFSWYPFNLGTVYVYAGLFRFLGIFGITDYYLIITVFASLLFTCGLICGTENARILGGKTSALLFLIFCSLCFPLYYCTSELYTDALALPFPMITLYFFLQSKKAAENGQRFIPWGILFALSALLGYLFRVTTLIIPVACLITALFDQKLRLFMACLTTCVCMLAAGNTLLEQANARHLGQEQLSVHRLSVWHYLAMGLPAHEDEGYGQYGDGGWLILSTSFDDPVARDARLRQEIKDRIYYLRYPNRMLNMLSRKNVSTFGDGTFHLNQLIEADEHEITNPLKALIYANGQGYAVFYHLCTALFYAEMLMAALTAFSDIRSGNIRTAPVFISLVGAFIYLTLWETNARYFFMFVFILHLACAIVPIKGERKTRPVNTDG